MRREVERGHVPLGRTVGIFDTEIHVATFGLERALQLASQSPLANIFVVLDKEEAALRLHTRTTTTTSAPAFQLLYSLCATWDAKRNQRLRRGVSIGRVYVQWCLGHTGIHGNEMADRVATEACDKDTERNELTIAKARRSLSERDIQAAQQYWRSHAPQSYQNVGLDMSVRVAPPELTLARNVLGRLLAARSHYGDFAAYHRRFMHDEAALYCSCGHETTPILFFFCSKARLKIQDRLINFRRTTTAIDWILGTFARARVFATRCAESRFFARAQTGRNL